MENINHDALQLAVNLLEGPAKALGVLAHLQCGGSYAARIRRLTRCEEHAVCLQILGCLDSGRHVCALCHRDTSVSHKLFRIIEKKLVLRCAGKRHVALDAPHASALMILCAGPCRRILRKPCAFYFLHFLEKRYVNTFRIIYPSGGIRHGDNLCAKLLCLLRRIDRHVSGTGNHNGLAYKIMSVAL